MSIADPGAGAGDRAARRAAREAVWVPWWQNATAPQKKDIVWDAFLEWFQAAPPVKQQILIDKVRVAMGDPDATIPEMKDWVYNALNVRQLLEALQWLSS
jgi:hypothetical protein